MKEQKQVKEHEEMKEQEQVKEHEEVKEQEQVKEHDEVKEQVKEQEKVKKRSRATHQQQVKPPPDERSLPGKVFVFQQHSVILNKVNWISHNRLLLLRITCRSPLDHALKQQN